MQSKKLLKSDQNTKKLIREQIRELNKSKLSKQFKV